ncbi:MAG: hypothetical protein LCH54_16175 [Bacteroidetes bacterium]|nr:hypothetical protein [Bacteroidota bacterium]
MNVLYLSDFYLSDHRLLENLGKAIKSSGEHFIIIPDGRRFAAEHNNIDLKKLTGLHPDILPESHENIIALLTGTVLKPMINFFAEGMAPAIAFCGHQRNLISLENLNLNLNLNKMSQLTAGVSNLVLLSSAESEGNPVFISPVSLAASFSKEQFTVFYLDEILPPDGISTFHELEIWAAPDQPAYTTWFWISEWNGSFPVTFLNFAGLRDFRQKKSQFLTLGK